MFSMQKEMEIWYTKMKYQGKICHEISSSCKPNDAVWNPDINFFPKTIRCSSSCGQGPTSQTVYMLITDISCENSSYLNFVFNVPDIRKTPLCVTAIGTMLRSHGALMHDLSQPNCLFTKTLHQCDAHTMTSRRPGHVLSATIGDLTAMLLWHRRPHYAAWALPLHLLHTDGVRTRILRRPSAFCCIFVV